MISDINRCLWCESDLGQCECCETLITPDNSSYDSSDLCCDCSASRDKFMKEFR
jgi:hypothetical protein